MELLHVLSVEDLRTSHKKWVEELFKSKKRIPERRWTQCITEESKNFVQNLKEQLGFIAGGSKVAASADMYPLYEEPATYDSHFFHETKLS